MLKLRCCCENSCSLKAEVEVIAAVPPDCSNFSVLPRAGQRQTQDLGQLGLDESCTYPSVWLPRAHKATTVTKATRLLLLPHNITTWSSRNRLWLLWYRPCRFTLRSLISHLPLTPCSPPSHLSLSLDQQPRPILSHQTSKAKGMLSIAPGLCTHNAAAALDLPSAT